MPKRGKHGEPPPGPAPPENELPVNADLDLDSEDEYELVDDEVESGSDDGSQSDDEVREALADYLRAAAAGRPAGAKGDGQRASTSDDDSEGDDDEGDEDDEDDEDEEAGGSEGEGAGVGEKRCAFGSRRRPSGAARRPTRDFVAARLTRHRARSPGDALASWGGVAAA